MLCSSLSCNVRASNTHNLIEHQFNNNVQYGAGKFHYIEKNDKLYTLSQKPNSSCLSDNKEHKSSSSNEPELLKKSKKLLTLNPENYSAAAKWPHSFYVCLSIKSSSGRSIGTGVMVGPHHILTTGHNVYDKDTSWAYKIDALPIFNRELVSFEKIRVTKAYIFPSWINENDSNNDIALLVLPSSIGNQIGWVGLLSLPDQKLKHRKVTITGYRLHNGPKEMLSQDCKIKHIEPERFEYDKELEAAQTGSGICINKWKHPYIIGLHTFAKSGDNKSNFGVRLSPQKFLSIVKTIENTFQIQEKVSTNPLTLPFQELSNSTIKNDQYYSRDSSLSYDSDEEV